MSGCPPVPASSPRSRKGWTPTGSRSRARGRVRAAQDASAELADSSERLTGASEAAATARGQAHTAQATYHALMETAGAAVEELHRRLDEVRRDLGQRDTAEKAAREDERRALTERGKAEGARDTLSGQ